MKRRAVLTTTAAIVFAGCLGGNDGGGDNTSNGSGTTDESAATSTETPTGGTVTPTATDAGTGTSQTVRETETETTTRTATESADTATESVETTTETATGTTNSPIPIPDAPTDSRKDPPLTGEAQVVFENGGSRVVVTGVITGKNGCQTAVLDSVRETNSGLVITVATERDAPANTSCSMALVEIEYRFDVSVETPPQLVTVVHRGMAGRRTITTVKRG